MPLRNGANLNETLAEIADLWMARFDKSKDDVLQRDEFAQLHARVDFTPALTTRRFYKELGRAGKAPVEENSGS